MTIWADADSLPEKVRDAIVKRTEKSFERRQKTDETAPCIKACILSNKKLSVRTSGSVRFEQTDGSPQAADRIIIALSNPGDLAVTRDIPLAGELLAKGVAVINHRGDEFKAETIRERLSVRDLMLEARLSGLAESGASSFGKADFKRFSDTFDRILTHIIKSDAR